MNVKDDPDQFPLWAVPVTIVERGRVAYVRARTKAAAVAKVRAAAWDEVGEPNDCTVTTAGRAKQVEP